MTTDATENVKNSHDSSTSDGAQDVIAPELLALLVCPVDHAQLNLVGETLVCTSCARVFPIEQGVPNMIVSDEA